MSRFIQEEVSPQKAPKKEKPRKLAGEKDYDYGNLKDSKDIPFKRGK